MGLGADQRPEGPSIFEGPDAFQIARTVALDLSAANIVPPEFQGNVGNCLLALDAASRSGLPVLEVMRTLHKESGKIESNPAADVTAVTHQPAVAAAKTAAEPPRTRRAYKRRSGGESSAETVTTQQQIAPDPPLPPSTDTAPKDGPNPPPPSAPAPAAVETPKAEGAADSGADSRQPGDLF